MTWKFWKELKMTWKDCKSLNQLKNITKRHLSGYKVVWKEAHDLKPIDLPWEMFFVKIFPLIFDQSFLLRSVESLNNCAKILIIHRKILFLALLKIYFFLQALHLIETSQKSTQPVVLYKFKNDRNLNYLR